MAASAPIGGSRRRPVLSSPKRSAPEPHPAVAFSHDGALLAVGGYREVLLFDAAGKRIGRLSGATGSVTCVAFSPDDHRLAASTGVPAQSGEDLVWDLGSKIAPVPAAGAPRALSGAHHDLVYSLAWSPDGRKLVDGSYDKLLALWDLSAPPGAKPRILKDHTDAVYAVAFSPSGTRIASASGDRTVKVWDAASGQRLFTLSDATAELYAVAFAPSGHELTAGGVDRMLRTWSLSPTAGALERSAFAHDGAVVRIIYSPDGADLFTCSEDRAVKRWDAASLQEKRTYGKQPDWPLGLAISPKGRTLAVSRYDGSVTLYDAASGAPARVLVRGAVAAKP